MDPSTQLVVSRRVESASALRSMVIGAVGLLLGGVFVLCTVFDLAVGFRGRIEAGPQEAVGMVLAALIAVLGGFSFVRGLVVREELSMGTDLASVALVTLVTVPLGALALGGYAYTHPPDKQLRDPSVPYTFAYPGKWEPHSIEGLPASWNVGTVEYVTAVGKRTGASAGQGVVVMAFVPKSRAWLIDWVRDPGQSGTRAANARFMEIAGRRAFAVDYEYQPGKPFQSQFALMNGRTAFVFTCFLELEPEVAQSGCRKVLDTFRFKPGYAPGASPRAR